MSASSRMRVSIPPDHEANASPMAPNVIGNSRSFLFANPLCMLLRPSSLTIVTRFAYTRGFNAYMYILMLQLQTLYSGKSEKVCLARVLASLSSRVLLVYPESPLVLVSVLCSHQALIYMYAEMYILSRAILSPLFRPCDQFSSRAFRA